MLNTSVQVFTESAQLDGLGINLSDVGMCLFTMANLQVGSQIQVEFLPPRSTELVRVSGIVRHRALYLYGVDFLVDSDQHSGNWAEVAQYRTAFGGCGTRNLAITLAYFAVFTAETVLNVTTTNCWFSMMWISMVF